MIKKTMPRMAAAAVIALALGEARASSHMDAPLITLDDPANTTDVYAFVSATGETRYLTTAVAVYPFEEPGIGPNAHRFDDQVRYNIHVALDDDIEQGRPTLTYSFDFDTTFANRQTVLQAYLGPILSGADCRLPPDQAFDPNQNLRQSYGVHLRDHRARKSVDLGLGVVPPNNQGLVTSLYNMGDDGDRRARGGVASLDDLDPYTRNAICELEDGHVAFAGQRDDGFFADIQSIFDLDFTFTGAAKPFDSQGGFNVHTIVLDIPIEELGGARRAGVYATTERQRTTKLSPDPSRRPDRTRGNWVQVARQGNPLFNEAFVPIDFKDLYSRRPPSQDRSLFREFALNPELAAALGLDAENREDLAEIFIPDLIKVDLTTEPARLAGQHGFSRLGVFGGDTLTNADGEAVAGGWPNGRRFGDDVLDIAIRALGLTVDASVDIDGVDSNDITYHQVFPYAATPLNGRNHGH